MWAARLSLLRTDKPSSVPVAVEPPGCPHPVIPAAIPRKIVTRRSEVVICMVSAIFIRGRDKYPKNGSSEKINPFSGKI
jgi:hypothetical protein